MNTSGTPVRITIEGRAGGHIIDTRQGRIINSLADTADITDVEDTVITITEVMQSTPSTAESAAIVTSGDSHITTVVGIVTPNGTTDRITLGMDTA